MNSNDSIIVDHFIAPACHQPVRILYRDDDILLIDKPSGLLSLSGKNPRNWDSVHYRLVHGQAGITPTFAEATLAHRLDFGTSGVMVVALHREASRHLNRQFQAREVKKAYLAVLEGTLAEQGGEINAAIAKDRALFPRVKLCQQEGRAAHTEYQVVERLADPARTLVRYIPHTGRTHQLRIHSWHIGHPILGCDLYHSEQSQQLASRLQLHASDLYFTHPRSGEVVHGHSPHPF